MMACRMLNSSISPNCYITQMRLSVTYHMKKISNYVKLLITIRSKSHSDCTQLKNQENTANTTCKLRQITVNRTYDKTQLLLSEKILVLSNKQKSNWAEAELIKSKRKTTTVKLRCFLQVKGTTVKYEWFKSETCPYRKQIKRESACNLMELLCALTNGRYEPSPSWSIFSMWQFAQMKNQPLKWQFITSTMAKATVSSSGVNRRRKVLAENSTLVWMKKRKSTLPLRLG